jgi:hypothetical protein
MMSFCRSAHLKAFLTALDAPSILKSIRYAFTKYFDFQFKGALGSDMRVFDGRGGDSVATWNFDKLAYACSPTVFAALSHRISLTKGADGIFTTRVQRINRVIMGGVDYAARNTSIGNSQILFCLPGQGERQLIPGQIDAIFVHERKNRQSGTITTDFFFAVRQYKQLDTSLIHLDPYRQFPKLHIALVYSDLDLCPSLILMKNDIHCHLGTCEHESNDFDQPVKAVISLDRVSPISLGFGLLYILSLSIALPRNNPHRWTALVVA